MADTGWLDLGTFATGGGTGTAWSTPSNAGASDNSYATCSTVALQSETLNATDLSGASPVPSGATIDGVEVQIERKANSTGVTDLTVRLIKGGTIQGDNKSTGAAWPTSDTYASFGGASDLWGLTLTDTDVNATDFGFCVAFDTAATRTGSVDHMQMKIYYTEAGTSFVATVMII